MKSTLPKEYRSARLEALPGELLSVAEKIIRNKFKIPEKEKQQDKQTATSYTDSAYAILYNEMPKRPKTKAKEKAWKEFSRYIRLRDCVRTCFTLDEGSCVTCNRPFPFKQLQAGHFIPGRNNAVLFNEKGVHAQCYGCNMGKGGAYHDYWLAMERMYGRREIDKQLRDRHKTVIYKEDDYIKIAAKYKKKADIIEKEFQNGEIA